MVLEFTLVFLLGLFVGMGVDDYNLEQKEINNAQLERRIIDKIKEDYNHGYIPDVDAYKKIYKRFRED